MTLEEYMKKNNITLRQMSVKLGICINYVFKIKKKYKNTVPSAKVISKIIEATGNEVKFEDLNS